MDTAARGGVATTDVVYVNYNRTDLLLRSVTSLRARTDPVRLGRVVVVDNASRAADRDRLSELPDGVDLVRNPTNAGFASAANLGARRGDGAVILFLNPDTEVPAGTVAALAESVDAHGGLALAGPRQFADPDRRLSVSPLVPWSAWREVANRLHARGWAGSASLRFLADRVRVWDRGRPVRVGALSGAALAVGRGAYDALGGFDEAFFLYGEDVDLCRRAAALGLPRLYHPGVTIFHWIEQSTNTRRAAAEAAMGDGRGLLRRRHHGLLARHAADLAAGLVSRVPRGPERRSPRELADPLATVPLDGGRAGRRFAVDLGRSTLFDNCLTALVEGDSFALPSELLARTYPGDYFLRVARETAPGRWSEAALYRFTWPGGGSASDAASNRPTARKGGGERESPVPLRVDQHVP